MYNKLQNKIRFTKYENDFVETKILEHLNLIVNEILQIKKPSIKSIILLGGFGRGEGSALVENDKVIPLNDYDILIVTDSLTPSYKLSVKLSKELYKKLGVNVDIFIKSTSSLSKLPPLIINYEIKYGSKIIWGEDVLKKIPEYKATDILLLDGVYLLFNRMLSLIYGWPLANDNRHFVIEQSVKGLYACCESLLLLSGNYHYSYEERNKRFKEIFPREFSQLYEEIPELQQYVDKAIKFKLKPDYSIFTDPAELWNKVVDMYFKVFNYYLKTYYQINSNDMKKIIEKFLESQKMPFYKAIVSWVYYIYQMYTHELKILKLNLKYPPNSFIYAAEAFLLKVLYDYPNYNTSDIELVREYLKKVINVKENDSAHILRKKCILAWSRGKYE